MDFEKFIHRYRENKRLIEFTTGYATLLIVLGAYVMVFAISAQAQQAQVLGAIAKVYTIVGAVFLGLFAVIAGLQTAQEFVFSKLVNEPLKRIFRKFFRSEKQQPVYLYALSVVVTSAFVLMLFTTYYYSK